MFGFFAEFVTHNDETTTDNITLYILKMYGTTCWAFFKPTCDTPRTENIDRIKPEYHEYQKHDYMPVLTTVRETVTAV